MEKLSTEKQTLGFFGALCGVMVSQLPELRLNEAFSFGGAAVTLAAIMALVLTVSFIRRGLDSVSGLWMVLSCLSFLAASVCFARNELTAIVNTGLPGLDGSDLQTLLLKSLLILYLVAWSTLSHLDR